MWEIRLKDGLYLQERVTDELTGDQRIISVKCKGEGRSERKRAKEKLEMKIAKGRPRKDKLSDLFDLYMREQEKTVKPTTFIVYCNMDKKIIETLGDVYIDRLSAGFIKKNLLASGKSMETCNGYIKRIKACLKWAYLNDLIPDPAVYEKLTFFPVTPVRVKIQDKFLEPDELNKLIRETPPALSLLIRFLALSGLRIGEAIALDNSDVWGSDIYITKTYSSQTHKSGTPKTPTSRREIHIQPELRECIKEIQAYMQIQQENMGYEPQPYLFTSVSGERLIYRTIEERLAKASQDIIGRRITCHVLRHTHASMLAAAGYPLEAISRRLGHEDCEITKAIYIHQTEKMKVKDAAALDKITMLSVTA